MAMVLDAFVGFFVERLGALVEEEIVMLLGVNDALNELKETLTRLQLLLADAESKKLDVKAVGNWLARLRDLMYDADDLIDDCRVEAEKHAPGGAGATGSGGVSPRSSNPCHSFNFFSCFCGTAFRHDIGKRIQSINDSLAKLREEVSTLNLAITVQPPVMPRTRSQSSPVFVESEIVGIDGDAGNLVDLLTGGNTRKGKCQVYAITGMPGIGKTTLAQKVFNDRHVQSHFEVVIWLSVSKEYDEVDLLKQVARGVVPRGKGSPASGQGEIYGDAKTKAEMDTIVKGQVESKRLLLVLDDIWESKVWERLKSPLQSAANDSRVLVTTRNEEVTMEISAAYTHHVKQLSDKDCWKMLCKVVFEEDEQYEAEVRKFEEVGMGIVRKCRGLPLAVKTVGGLLKTRERTEDAWKRVRDSRTWDIVNLKEDIKPGLLLSYEDLPSHLKQCFIYCSLFPEDFRFHQHNLVLMWIAEGFVTSENGNLEQLGDDYYRELVMRNLLQAASEYYDGKGCTMHDLVRALALYVSQNDDISEHRRHGRHHLACGSSAKVRYMSIVKKEQSEVPMEISRHECLRTLLLSRNPLVKSIPPEFFEKLRRLRVLDLSYTGIDSLPDTLGKLIHLRFLNVAFTKLKELPETVQNLQNLETLKANGSKNLRELPAGIVQLRNLRHLAVGSTDTHLNKVPTGIGRLTNLRTFNGFVSNDGNNNGMNELEHLSHLMEITMFKLERVASKVEAEKARIGDKTKLKYLRLSCTRKAKALQLEEAEMKRIEDVFEGLNPPISLEALHIESFFGRELPSHIKRCSLSNLTWLKLDDCKYMNQLPALGQLPELKVLILSGVTTVSEITSGFFGVKGFPKLQDFYLWGMSKLERISPLHLGALPKLKKLQIIRCPKLLSLPDGLQHAPKLAQLVIEEAQSLKVIKNLRSVTELKLRNNQKLKALADLPSVSILSMKNCPSLKDVQCTNALTYVMLSDDKMVALPEWLLGATSLKKLNVMGITTLVSRCCKDGADWPKIERILHVEARSHDGSSYVSYRRNPFCFQSNLTDDGGEDEASFLTHGASINNEDEDYGGPSFGEEPFAP